MTGVLALGGLSACSEGEGEGEGGIVNEVEGGEGEVGGEVGGEVEED